MRRLFQFLYKYRALFVFLLLETVCGWLIIDHNSYQRIAFLKSSSQLVGGITSFTDDVAYYFQLRQVNEQLAEENARLRDEVSRYQQSLLFSVADYNPRPERIDQYHYLQAKVVNNSLLGFQNYLTINKGSLDGVTPGMGVLGPRGVVGKVRYVSRHYSTITSLLHSDIQVSARLRSTKNFGTLSWNQESYRKAELKFIPRHVIVSTQDTVETTDFNAVFPPGLLIGTVDTVNTQPNSTFHEISVALATDFNDLEFVYLIENRLREEKDSIELSTDGN